MTQTPVIITPGTGGASIAAELVSGTSWQQIQVYGGGGSSVLSVNPDGSFKASIIGTPTVTFSGAPSISGAVTIVGTPSISGTVNVGSILTLATDQSVLGAISSTQSVAIQLNGQAAVGIQVPAGFTGTLTPQVSVDGNNFTTTTMLSVSTGTPVTSTAANGMWQANTAGFKTFQILGNVTAGIASVLLRASQAPATVMLDNPIPTGSNTIGNVGINGGSNNIGSINIRDTAGNTITATANALQVSVIGTPTVSFSGSPSISGAVTIVGNTTPPGSVSGTVGASVIGTVPVTQVGSWTLTGSVLTMMAPVASLVSAVTSIITTTGQTSVLATAPGAQRNYVTQMLITNAGAVGTQVNIMDGPNVVYAGYAAASGGGFAASFPVPFKQATLAQSLDVKAVTTTSITAAMSGFTAA